MTWGSRISDLGCFGGEIDTPHLDKLAYNGLRFTEFYNTARCWPTRATCLDLAGANYPQEYGEQTLREHDSLSLVPIFKNSQNDREHAYLFNHSGTHAVVKGDYKIVRERKGDWALYNLARNRTETNNLAGEKPELVKELAAVWEGRWGRK